MCSVLSDDTGYLVFSKGIGLDKNISFLGIGRGKGLDTLDLVLQRNVKDFAHFSKVSNKFFIMKKWWDTGVFSAI